MNPDEEYIRVLLHYVCNLSVSLLEINTSKLGRSSSSCLRPGGPPPSPEPLGKPPDSPASITQE